MELIGEFMSNIRSTFVLNGIREWLSEQDNNYDDDDIVHTKLSTQQLRQKISELEKLSKLIPEDV